LPVRELYLATVLESWPVLWERSRDRRMADAKHVGLAFPSSPGRGTSSGKGIAHRSEDLARDHLIPAIVEDQQAPRVRWLANHGSVAEVRAEQVAVGGVILDGPGVRSLDPDDRLRWRTSQTPSPDARVGTPVVAVIAASVNPSPISDITLA
jgi:hypothetical protein